MLYVLEIPIINFVLKVFVILIDTNAIDKLLNQSLKKLSTYIYSSLHNIQQKTNKTYLIEKKTIRITLHNLIYIVPTLDTYFLVFELHLAPN